MSVIPKEIDSNFGQEGQGPDICDNDAQKEHLPSTCPSNHQNPSHALKYARREKVMGGKRCCGRESEKKKPKVL